MPPGRSTAAQYSGSWDGHGYGHGYGHGDGHGYGHGYWHGYGYGDGAYWRTAVASYARQWTRAQRARLVALERAGATIAYWVSGPDGRPCNGGHGESVAVGLVQTVAGPLALCQRGTLHATLLPTKWHGTRRWIVALVGEVVGDDEKFGALQREILGEALSAHQHLGEEP